MKSNNVKFMHINKTAGNSVFKWLTKITGLVPNLKRSNHNIFENYDKKYFYFTIVRNPYDRVASIYYQWTIKEYRKFIDENKVKSLDDFVQKICSEVRADKIFQQKYYEKFQIKYVSPCSHWIKFDEYKIFKIENLQELIDFFCSNFKPLKDYHKSWLTKRDNRDKATTTHRLNSYKHQYNSKSLQLIQETFKEDFEKFGYEL